MRAVRLAVAALVVFTCARAADPISKQEYRSRREALRRSLSDGVTVLFGRTDAEEADSRSGFRQEPNFYYLTGWQEPGAILVLASRKGDILFLPQHNLTSERYGGPRAGPEDQNVRTLTGFDTIEPVERFEAEFSRLLEAEQKIYTLPGAPRTDSLRSMFPLRDFGDAARPIGMLRLKKSPAEIELIRRSLAATIEAHRAAWKWIAPGLYEYQVAAMIVGSYLEQGCERSAYSPIVASGIDATVLHYSRNSRRMENGELLLMDAAAECSCYAADITRTVPVDGKFTPRQRELYEVVLGAQKAVIAAVKPGMTFDRGTAAGLSEIAYKYIDTHGTDRQGNPLGRYFTHKVGHHVGLEVHDAGSLLTYGPLEPGMVITVEPGIYIPEEEIGIRIEDMLLVTDSGAEVLSSALPKEPRDIEKAMAR